MNQVYKNLALWMVIGLIVILLFNLFQTQQSTRGEIVFSDFLKKVDANEVKEVTLRGNSVNGRLSDGSTFKTRDIERVVTINLPSSCARRCANATIRTGVLCVASIR